MVHFILVLAICKSGNISLNILLSAVLDKNKWLDSTHFKARMISVFLIMSPLAKVIWVPFRLNALSPFFLNIDCPFLFPSPLIYVAWIFTWAIPTPLIESTFEHILHRAENSSVLLGWTQANSAPSPPPPPSSPAPRFIIVSFSFTRHLKNWVKLEHWR